MGSYFNNVSTPDVLEKSPVAPIFQEILQTFK